MHVQNNSLVPVNNSNLYRPKNLGELPKGLVIEILEWLANDPKTFLKLTNLNKTWRAIILDPVTTSRAKLQEMAAYTLLAPPPKYIGLVEEPKVTLSVTPSSGVHGGLFLSIHNKRTLTFSVLTECPEDKRKQWGGSSIEWKPIYTHFISEQELVTVSENGVIIFWDITQKTPVYKNGVSLNQKIEDAIFIEEVFLVTPKDHSIPPYQIVVLPNEQFDKKPIDQYSGYVLCNKNIFIKCSNEDHLLKFFEKSGTFFVQKWESRLMNDCNEYSKIYDSNEDYFAFGNFLNMQIFKRESGDLILNFNDFLHTTPYIREHVLILEKGKVLTFYDLKTKEKLPFEHSLADYVAPGGFYYLNTYSISNTSNNQLFLTNKVGNIQDKLHSIRFGYEHIPLPQHAAVITPIITKKISKSRWQKLRNLASRICICFNRVLKALFCCKK